jgi:hypothetical protein
VRRFAKRGRWRAIVESFGCDDAIMYPFTIRAFSFGKWANEVDGVIRPDGYMKLATPSRDDYTHLFDAADLYDLMDILTWCHDTATGRKVWKAPKGYEFEPFTPEERRAVTQTAWYRGCGHHNWMARMDATIRDLEDERQALEDELESAYDAI